MKDNKEQMSALMDGELDVQQCDFLIRKLNHESSLQQSWHRYHITRACIQREFDGCTSLVGRVRLALAEVEPDQSAVRAAFPWLKTGVGGALAACVALVAIVGLNTRLAPTGENEFLAEPAPAFVSQSTALDRQFSRQAVPVSLSNLPAGTQTFSASQIAAQPFTETRARINRYIIRHNQAVGANGMVSFTPILTVPLEQPSSTAADAAQNEQNSSEPNGNQE